MSTHVPDIPDSVSTSDVAGVPVVGVTGEVDEHTAGPIRAELAAQLDSTPRAIVLDLSAVTFFGSTGLAVLVETHQQAERQHTIFVIVAAQRVVLRPMRVTGVDRLLTVHEALPDALTALRAQLVI